MPGTLPRLIRSANPAGAWNHYEIVANGNIISVKLNGMPVAELQNGTRRAKGFIALPNHHPGSKVQFRNIRIKA